MTQPAVPEFDTDELLTATKLNQLGDAVAFLQAVDGTYTPVLSAGGGTPALGANGFLTGKWWRHSNHVTAIAELNIEGAGASIVGTSWRITLPFVADLTLHTSNVLNAASDIIGNFQTRSATATEALHGSVLLSGPSGTDTTGNAMIFYFNGSNTSVGAVLFTTSVRIKAIVHYVADPTAI